MGSDASANANCQWCEWICFVFAAEPERVE
jgi:hypothetical protein